MSRTIETKRKTIKQRESYTVTLPKKWLDFMQYLGKDIDEVHMVANGILIMALNKKELEYWKATLEAEIMEREQYGKEVEGI